MPKDELTVELLIVIDVEMRGLPPLAPPPRVCGEVYLTLPLTFLDRRLTAGPRDGEGGGWIRKSVNP